MSEEAESRISSGRKSLRNIASGGEASPSRHIYWYEIVSRPESSMIAVCRCCLIGNPNVQSAFGNGALIRENLNGVDVRRHGPVKHLEFDLQRNRDEFLPIGIP